MFRYTLESLHINTGTITANSLNTKNDRTNLSRQSWCKRNSRTQNDLMHRCRVTLKIHNAREDQPGCLALWMRTRHLICWSEALQVPLNFIHHLVGCSVFECPPQIGLALVAETKDTLRRLAGQLEAVFKVFFWVSGRDHRLYRRMSHPWPSAVATLLSVA